MISVIDVQLRYSDTDQMGVIYHANYFSYFEQGRTAFLKDLGMIYSDIEKAGLLFPVRDVQCTYLKAIRYGDRVSLKTVVTQVSKIQIEYAHELINQDGEVCAKGKSVVVSVNKENFMLKRFDKDYPELYNKYLENIR